MAKALDPMRRRSLLGGDLARPGMGLGIASPTRRPGHPLDARQKF